jgi:hypothetical protein
VYLNVAKQWTNELFAVGKSVEDDDLISVVASGLNPLFNTFVTVDSFAAHGHGMSFANFQTKLLSHELPLENQQQKALTLETSSFALYTKK